MSLAAVPLALAIDAVTGEPDIVWRRIGHPVTWIGRVIDAADSALNRGRGRRLRGVLALALVLALFVLPTVILTGLLAVLPFPVALFIEALAGSTLLAHRSLYDHVRAVAVAPSLAEARVALAKVVGRDVNVLGEEGVAGAALETLSEGLSDGVIAPAFFFALFGLPGLVAYKVVNTADSMIGHRTPRHEAFGWAAARLDDVMNLVPARLTALLTLIAAPRALPAWRQVMRDAAHHVSPNAGWPESAFARSLGVAMGGPRRYGTRVVDGAWLNAEGRTTTRADIMRGLALSVRVGVIAAALYLALALV